MALPTRRPRRRSSSRSWIAPGTRAACRGSLCGRTDAYGSSPRRRAEGAPRGAAAPRVRCRRGRPAPAGPRATERQRWLCSSASTTSSASRSCARSSSESGIPSSSARRERARLFAQHDRELEPGHEGVGALERGCGLLVGQRHVEDLGGRRIVVLEVAQPRRGAERPAQPGVRARPGGALVVLFRFRRVLLDEDHRVAGDVDHGEATQALPHARDPGNAGERQLA